ncbi:hypothetical protein ARMGADRAFT_1138931 [Armillaria gallica]|uniref:Uncharacterized protein n=1 Tax=Armillaria gallica TaxID=47427 RepID=A0A2H3DYN4_ARMGA|nr:hypothetical protein ARMGADRAFT_1138931 [Armillaria gallica]
MAELVREVVLAIQVVEVLVTELGDKTVRVREEKIKAKVTEKLADMFENALVEMMVEIKNELCYKLKETVLGAMQNMRGQQIENHKRTWKPQWYSKGAELWLQQDPAASGTGSEPVRSHNVAPEKCVHMVRNIVQSCSLIPDKASVLQEEYEEQIKTTVFWQTIGIHHLHFQKLLPKTKPHEGEEDDTVNETSDNDEDLDDDEAYELFQKKTHVHAAHRAENNCCPETLLRAFINSRMHKILHLQKEDLQLMYWCMIPSKIAWMLLSHVLAVVQCMSSLVSIPIWWKGPKI